MYSAIEEDDGKVFSARLIYSERITPASSPEDVKHLVFSVDDPSFQCRAGQCIRVLAPGQAGNPYHARLYSIVDFAQNRGRGSEFTLCVRRCTAVDEGDDTKHEGLASSYLCNLRPGGTIEFSGPCGYPFPIPENRRSGILMLGMGTGIAPFVFLIKQIYETLGGWEGKVRLFYGARSPLEFLYMNNTNSELAKYYDEETFRAFRAMSPGPSPDEPSGLYEAIKQHRAEVWEMLDEPDTHVYIAGAAETLELTEKALEETAGSREAWSETKNRLVSSGQWIESVY